MALITYPLNNTEYSAEDAELFHATRTSGVFANDSFPITATGSDNTVLVGTGIGWIKNGDFAGKVVALKTAQTLEFDLSDSVYPRIDSVVIQFNSVKNATDLIIKKGVAATSPVAPDVVREESIYELHLYHVRRNAGALVITESDISDLRSNSNYCGLMADAVTDWDKEVINQQVLELMANYWSKKDTIPVENGGTGAKTKDEAIENIGAVPTSRTVNNKPLSSNITLSASDIGAVPTSRTINQKPLTEDISISPSDIDAVPTSRKVNNKSLKTDITLSASDVDAVPTTRTVNGKSLKSDINLKATDVSALNAGAGIIVEAFTDMDDITTPGTYRIQSDEIAATVTNLPYTVGSSIIDVRVGGFLGTLVQIQYATASQYVPMYVRRYLNGEWSDWECFVRSVNGITPSKTNGEVTLKPADIGSVPTTRKVNEKTLNTDITLKASDVNAVSVLRGSALAESTNMNTIKNPGTYHVVSETVAATITNLPYTAGSSIIDVREGGDSGDIVQIQYATASQWVPMYIRRYDGATWSDWGCFVRSVNGITPSKTNGEVTLKPADIDEPETVSLTWASVVDAAGDTSYTIRYNPFTNTCFFRGVIEIDSALSADTSYDVAIIATHKPSYGTALAVFSSKKCKAMINSEGVIRLRAEETIGKDYVVYMAGFWFA